MIDILSNLYGERIIEIQTHLQIPGDEYMVYIFGMNDSAVVVGHGKKIRSKVISDDLNQITKNHIKAFYVRCCLLYGEGPIDRLVIRCQNKQEALQTECVVHGLIGGNVLQLPPEVEDQLFLGFINEKKANFCHESLEFQIRNSAVVVPGATRQEFTEHGNRSVTK